MSNRMTTRPRRATSSPSKHHFVIGDGAVGLSAVLSGKQSWARRRSFCGRAQARTDLGREFGATDVVAERGEAGVAKVQEITDGEGSRVVLEAVGLLPALTRWPTVSSVPAAWSPGRRPAVLGRPLGSRRCSARSPSPVVSPPPGPTWRTRCRSLSRAPLIPARSSTGAPHGRRSGRLPGDGRPRSAQSTQSALDRP